MKADLHIRVCSVLWLVLCGVLHHQTAEAAPPPQWKESGVFAYNANGVPLQKVLADFAQNFGATLNMSAPPRGVVNGRIQGATPEEFLDRLALTYQFNWFFYNNQLHIAPISDRVTERIRVGDMTTSDVKQALLGVGLFEPKFGWGELQDDSAVLVAGPREYVRLVKSAVTAETSGVNDETMIFRLRHAFLEDREINFRDKSVKVPGMLTILRNLMGDSRPSSNISDGGGTSSPSSKSMQNQQPQSLTPEYAKKNVPRDTSAERKPDTNSGKETQKPVIEGDVRTNTIIIRGDTSKREYYRSLIAQLDMPQQMVEIEALIIDIQKSKIKELGIDWALTFGGGSGKTTVSTNNIAGLPVRDTSTLTINNLTRFLTQIRALEGQGSASIVGKPAVMTMENIGAVIDLSRTVYIKLVGERAVDAVPVTVGTLMKVTPKVIREGATSQVQLFIDIEDGSMTDVKSNETPVVERSVVATQMVVDDQQSLVIGGYNLQSSSNGRNGVPGVSKVPLVGGLFRSESNVSEGRERIFIITPRLVDNRKSQIRAKYVSESVQQPQTKMDGTLKMDLSGLPN
jgi:type III secretion protein C